MLWNCGGLGESEILGAHVLLLDYTPDTQNCPSFKWE